MQENKVKGFGFRGWMLIIFQAFAYITFQVFCQYPLNILSDFYGGATVVSKYYSICAMIGVLIQIILIGPISKIKSIKKFCMIMGGITLILALGVMFVPAGALWVVCYSLINVTSVFYATITLGILVGQWFPTRKGSIMGIATLAFPIANGLIGLFASNVYAAIGIGGNPYTAIGKAFLPFFIVALVGWLIGLIFISDYPEQVGAFRDNNKNMTAEAANAIMLQEMENKKSSVWTIPHMLKSKEFWLSTIVNALLLGTAIGLLSQSMTIIKNSAPEGQDPESYYSMVMGIIMVFGMIGSFVLGLLDNRIGTRKAMIISTCLMIIAGIFGVIGTSTTVLIAMVFVALFMGASSNFGVSCAAQYWRREDFGRIFMLSSPIGTLITSAAPMVIAALLFGADGYKGPSGVFTLIGICGVIALIAMILFNPRHIKVQDDEYRKAAGKVLDDALANRK